MKPRIVLIIGPTAVGKSSMLDKALKEFPRLRDIVTYTTRPARAGESEGNPYHFVSEEKFKELRAQGRFVEWAFVHGRLYGTPKDQIESETRNGNVLVADVDVQGAKKLVEIYPDGVTTIFLMPPSMDALRQRFIKRGVTSEADLAKRLESAQQEISQAQDFQFVLTNEDFDSCYGEVRKIIENLLKNQ